MKILSLNSIKPDPNQPRRTFNAEKMEALEASMKADGFRKECPIILNGGNLIVDGERRWRAAKAVGIKEVPVEIKHATAEERLLYQLQSEGVEIESDERDNAYLRLYELGQKSNPKKYTYVYWATKLGITESAFRMACNRADAFRKIEQSLPTVAATVLKKQYGTMVEIGIEKDIVIRKKLGKKALKENWSRDKAREIRKTINENPLRQEQILSQDYSDPYEGSGQWKNRLEVAKTNIDLKEIKELDDTRKMMQSTVDAYDRMIEYGLKFAAALRDFDFMVVTPQTRVRVHQQLLRITPFATGYLTDLENYMIEHGELDRADIKKLK